MNPCVTCLHLMSVAMVTVKRMCRKAAEIVVALCVQATPGPAADRAQGHCELVSC